MLEFNIQKQFSLLSSSFFNARRKKTWNFSFYLISLFLPIHFLSIFIHFINKFSFSTAIPSRCYCISVILVHHLPSFHFSCLCYFFHFIFFWKYLNWEIEKMLKYFFFRFTSLAQATKIYFRSFSVLSVFFSFFIIFRLVLAFQRLHRRYNNHTSIDCW